MSEPEYVDDPFDDDDGMYRIPKWRIPSSDMQRRMLSAVGCKYWPLGSRTARSAFIIAEKSTMPVGKIIPEWPLEWFENCLKWVENKRKKKEWPGFKGFMTLYMDADAREEFRHGLVHSRQEPSDNEYR